MTDRAQLAAQIAAVATLQGEFTLRSGQVSDHYFDKYLFEADPALLAAISAAMKPLVPAASELLAGLELGGIPLATMLSNLTGLPCLFVRKQAKTYGTAKLAEGPAFAGRKVLVVEDVVTTGGQLVESIGALRDHGAIISHALCVIDRGSEGVANLAAIDVELLSLFRGQEL